MENKTDSNTIHLALGFDQNYIVHIYALLTSIFYNNKTNKITFHVIATGINISEIEKLTGFIKNNNAEVFFYSISEEMVKAQTVIPSDSHFTIATYYRLFFPSLVDAGISKLLYIDADTIVNGNLIELYNTNIGNSPVGAVPDSFPVYREDLGIVEPGKYFNAGVLLIDTRNWRQQKVSENAFEFLRLYPEKALWVDQDALNATLIGKWFKLDTKYNFTLFDVKLQVPVDELVKDVVIVHYTSWRKPWNALTRNKLRYLYHYYLKLSPKSNEKKYVDFKWDLKSLWTFTRIRLKEYYFDKKIDKIFPIKKWSDPYEVNY